MSKIIVDRFEGKRLFSKFSSRLAIRTRKYLFSFRSVSNERSVLVPVSNYHKWRKWYSLENETLAFVKPSIFVEKWEKKKRRKTFEIAIHPSTDYNAIRHGRELSCKISLPGEKSTTTVASNRFESREASSSIDPSSVKRIFQRGQTIFSRGIIINVPRLSRSETIIHVHILHRIQSPRRCGIIGRRNENHVLPFFKADTAKWFYNYYHTNISWKLHKLNHPYRCTTHFSPELKFWLPFMVGYPSKEINYYFNKETKRVTSSNTNTYLPYFHFLSEKIREKTSSLHREFFSDSPLEKKEKERKYHGVNAPTLNACPREKISRVGVHVYLLSIYFFIARPWPHNWISSGSAKCSKKRTHPWTGF